MDVYMKILGFIIAVLGFVLAIVQFTGLGPEQLTQALLKLPMSPIMWVGVGILGIVIIFLNRRPGD